MNVFFQNWEKGVFIEGCGLDIAGNIRDCALGNCTYCFLVLCNLVGILTEELCVCV